MFYMSDVIAKKRDGGELSGEEIRFVVSGFTSGDIPDYQMSALLMAIYFRGMTHRETTDLTLAMMNSGETLDLSGISGVKADKHSTGGVGDKTSLVLCPLVASLGVKMAKMSGRGLGHTGGTIDKLESIPGFSSSLSQKQFMADVERVGFAIAGQTADLDPADKKMYALRDVTGTVGSRPLIVSSIMSKKLAAGADVIVLDVKSGSGGFMKNDEDALLLAREMVDVGKAAGRHVTAVVTDMSQPLGSAVGNALEVKEAIAALKGEYGGDLLELCLVLGAQILVGAGKCASGQEARQLLEDSIKSGRALKKLEEFVTAQGGDAGAIYDTAMLPQAPVMVEAVSGSAGYVESMDTEGVGRVCVHLGGGRISKDSAIDLSVGLVIHKKVGDRVEPGDSLATIHASTPEQAAEAVKLLEACYTYSDAPVEKRALIRGVVN